GSLQPKRLSFWKKAYRKAFTPRTVSFTPGRLIPAAVTVGLFLIFMVNMGYLGPLHKAQHEALDLKNVPVTFVLEKADAEAVSVIGSFNGWEPDQYEMRLNRKKNRWTLTVMLPPGQHEYAFLINGEKAMPDPRATFTRSDGFGSRNSVIFAGNHSEIRL
ncbi:MAG: isoamylase early set domain-containing protein, partial [Deltaproteobacteria bacterium]|nr:isoamylase early set domain-containing protein [Deltaproteobacteria bacterium]